MNDIIEVKKLENIDLISHLDLDKFKLTTGPPTISYIPDFVTQAEEDYLLKKVNEAPLPRWTQLSNRRLQNWGGDPHPKGMIAEAIPDWLKKYSDRVGTIDGIFEGCPPNHVLVNEYLPGQGIMPHLDGPLFHPTITTISLGSHTVINFYRPVESESNSSVDNNGPSDRSGQSSSNAESSSRRESSSIGTGTGMGSWSERLEFSLLLQPRSLLVLRDSAYNYYLHGIDEISSDKICPSIVNVSQSQLNELNLCPGNILERSTRVSLTIRHVPKTTKPMLKLFGKTR